MPDSSNKPPAPGRKPSNPFRKAVLRGLGILMPPLLTIALFFWAWNLIEDYVLVPLESGAESVITLSSRDVLRDIPDELTDPATGEFNKDPRISREGAQVVSFRYEKLIYTREDGTWLRFIMPRDDGTWVGYMPRENVRKEFLSRQRTLPPFVAGLILVCYLLGKFVAAPVGHMIVGIFDRLILRLPLISNVYSAVKQVTDFVFVEREIEFNRVVAVEYPRKGIWSIGFVTGESMLDIRSAADEPVLSVLMPTSPLPVTGFTITVLKSEAVDLNISVDQAIQFIVSCGVVVPYQQQILDNSHIAGRVTDVLAGQTRDAEGTALERTTDSNPTLPNPTQPSDTQESSG